VLSASSEGTAYTTVGWLQQCSSFGQIFLHPLAAGVRSGAGSWQWTWLVTVACSLLGLMLARQIGLQLAVRAA